MSLTLKNGDFFSGCEIIAKCGAGSFGTTYLAKNPIGQKIIIKIVSSSRCSERELRGLQSYMAVSGKHPNLLQIFHIGQFEDGFYYVMEPADNCGSDDNYEPATLGNFFRKDKEFSPEKAIEITRELLAGLKFMHEANLIHRDIKPDNIIFVNGRPKLSDPGLVIEAGQKTSAAGTLGFLPPEILNSDTFTDQSTDIYALGKVFYCMVTGMRPRQYPQLPLNMRTEICRQIYPALSRMCNRNPNKRFKNVDEFLAGLPVKLEKPTRFEIMRTNFRDWKILNHEKYLFYLWTTIIIITLLFCSFAAFAIIKIKQANMLEKCVKNIEKFNGINQKRRDLLDIQIREYLPDQYKKYKNLSEKFNQNYSLGNYIKADNIRSELEFLLKDCALKLIPEIPAKHSGVEQDIKKTAEVHGFLSTPLAEYLSKTKIAEIKKNLAVFESGAYSGYSGPRCDREWNNFNFFATPFIFVPPGVTVLPHNKKIVKIPYHFWICKNEILSEIFFAYTGCKPQFSAHSNVPVERITWNDLLFFCLKITENFKKQNYLPPGYIIRPLTEAEWQFAADNAWLGKDDSPPEEYAVCAENSKHTRPPGFKNANKLGIFDMYGNVTEIVQPVEATKMQQSNIIRGGSFKNTAAKCLTYRGEFLAYQNIPYDIGSRIAIAPGDMDYFDKNFFNGSPVQGRANGKVYELIGINFATFNWQNADMLSKLLGGKLAEPQNMQELRNIIKVIPLTGKWRVFFGGIKVDNKWIWQSSRKELNYGSFKKTLNKDDSCIFLARELGKWSGVNSLKCPIFVCEWDEKNYEKRNEHLKNSKKLPGELLRFSIGDRKYMLIHAHIGFYSAMRIAELLGGKLACPDNEELYKQLVIKLKDFSNQHILLGGYAKYGKYYWLSGNEIKMHKIKKQLKSQISSRNFNGIVICNGELYDTVLGQSFLVEWPASSSSSY